MEQLIQACRAYASELPPHVHGLDESVTAAALLIFACIGFLWTLNKIVEFVVRQPRRF